MQKSGLNEVLVYHDETKGFAGGSVKGHVLLFVPQSLSGHYYTPLFGEHYYKYHPIKQLVDEMLKIRKRFYIDKKLHFNDISGKRWGKFDLGVRTIVSIGVDSLRKLRPQVFDQPLCCKLAVIFYPRKPDLKFYGGEEKKEKQLRHDETTMRILLKGAAHYLYSPTDKVIIKGIISDGDPYHRKLDAWRVIKQITVDEFSGRTPLREYALFSEDAEIRQLPSDHKLYEFGSNDYNHANLLQLADLFLGSVIRACHVGCVDCPTLPPFDQKVDGKRDIIAYPVKEMLKKVERAVGFAKSGHFKSFTINSIGFESHGIHFSRLTPKEVGGLYENLDLDFSCEMDQS